MALILIWIVCWCVLVAEIGGRLSGWVQLPYYLVVGIVWIFPLRPLLRWMETGRWRRVEEKE